MPWKRIIGTLFVLYIANLFYVPIPNNMNEKFKYRTVLALNKFSSHVMRMNSYIQRDVISQTNLLRNLCSFLENYCMPSGEIYGPDVELKKDTFDGVKVHIYNPPDKGTSLRPAFIYIHGGGLSLFDAGYYDGLTRQICLALNAVVISIDYRRTPEVRFPIPYEDSLRATKWFLNHVEDYNVDSKRVAIGGDSAGGYLSATISQAIHDDQSISNIKIQVLLYPWLQIMDLNTPSYQKYYYDTGTDGIVPLHTMSLFSAMHVFGKNTNSSLVQTFIENHHISPDIRNSDIYRERLSHSLIPEELRNPIYYTAPTKIYTPPSDRNMQAMWEGTKDFYLDPRLSPFFRKDLSGLPTAYIATMEYDSIRDDGIMYAKLLEKAGTDVTWRHYDGAFHGIVWAGPGVQFDLGEKILQEMFEFVKQRL